MLVYWQRGVQLSLCGISGVFDVKCFYESFSSYIGKCYFSLAVIRVTVRFASTNVATGLVCSIDLVIQHKPFFPVTRQNARSL